MQYGMQDHEVANIPELLVMLERPLSMSSINVMAYMYKTVQCS